MQGAGASFSVFVLYLQPVKLIAYIYTNKYKCKYLSGIIITNIEVKRVTRREQLFIVTKYQDFQY